LPDSNSKIAAGIVIVNELCVCRVNRMGVLVIVKREWVENEEICPACAPSASTAKNHSKTR
jgi:hypothetical protein